MTTTLTTTGVKKLKINKLTKTQLAAATISNTEMYLVNPEFVGGKLLVTDNDGDIVESTLQAPSKWVASNSQFYNATTLANSDNPSTYTVDLSTYLPDDGAQYEVIFRMSVSGTYNAMIDSDIGSNLSQIYSSTNAGDMTLQRILPVGTGRNIKLKVYTTLSSFSLFATAYRKVG